jgi:arylsulfatase A-like enzyme
LQESLRADVTCIEYDPACALATRATNAAAPERLPLVNVRANGSATAVAMAVLFTGLDPTAPKARLLEAPTMWEYAHAAGYDTAYFGSQHLMFANMWLWVEGVPSGRITLGTHLDTQADMFSGADDRMLSRSVAAALPALREPFFAVVHYANVHTPRRWDPEPGPFSPARQDKADRGEYFNGYKNAVHRSDSAVAELLRALRASPAGPRTVVVFTADHGEAMWEHGQGCDHGCTLFDEETRVPAWIDAPEGTLSPAERAAAAAARGAHLFHVDIAATLLDLLGVWDAPALAPFRRRMLGQPITRPEREERTIPMSNVSHVWERGVPSYGLMRGRLKLAGRHREPGFSCFDVEADPEEAKSLPDACADLKRAAAEVYGRPPSDFDRLVFHPEWGPFLRE